MLVSTWLTDNVSILKSAGCQTARLDCLVLLEDATSQDRSWLLAHPEYTLTAEVLGTLDVQISDRKVHLPLAYIRGKAEFYGRDFIVDKRVLIPRPESESIIQLLLKLPIAPSARILDVGTGSGCLGITAALEMPGATVEARDISPGSLVVAKQNARKLHAAVTFYQGDLLDSTVGYDVMLCNLPYVPEDYAVNQAARFEPKLAIFAGVDGLGLFRRLFEQIATLVEPPKYILTESLIEQHLALGELASTAGYYLEVTDGLVQQFRLSAN